MKVKVTAHYVAFAASWNILYIVICNNMNINIILSHARYVRRNEFDDVAEQTHITACRTIHYSQV